MAIPLLSLLPVQGVASPSAPLMPVQALPDTEHDAYMIEGLCRHIHDSLIGIPGDLPVLKGVHTNLLDAFSGQDDFNHMDYWLQGLLCYFKLHRLMGMDRDADWILVTGTCLTRKAKQWFSQEVECLTRFIHDWTLESVIIGLYCMFITTATA
jgi:hypothetical protein